MARYVKQTWTDGSGGGTPISAARLGVVETGVFAVDYRPAARVFHNAAQAITTATETALAFNSERFDTEANAASTIHDTITNNSRLTCRTAGKYLIVAQIEWATNATGERGLFLRLNGATAIGRSRENAGAAVPISMNAVTIYDLAVNDYVEATVFQTSGGNLNVNTSANYSPEFSMVLVG